MERERPREMEGDRGPQRWERARWAKMGREHPRMRGDEERGRRETEKWGRWWEETEKGKDEQ